MPPHVLTRTFRKPSTFHSSNAKHIRRFLSALGCAHGFPERAPGRQKGALDCAHGCPRKSPWSPKGSVASAEVPQSFRQPSAQFPYHFKVDRQGAKRLRNVVNGNAHFASASPYADLPQTFRKLPRLQEYEKSFREPSTTLTPSFRGGF